MKCIYLSLRSFVSCISLFVCFSVVLAEAPKADLLDVKFNENGTATDLSDKGMTVDRIGTSDQAQVYYNEAFGRYVAKFLPTLPGSSTSTSEAIGGRSTTAYFKADYTNDTDFSDRLADGHSLEVLCMLQLNGGTHANVEIKPFASHQTGGTGFLVAQNNHNRSLTFLPNISATTSSNWAWVDTNVYPADGEYYHAVGVWNKTENKVMVYINGELNGSRVFGSDTTNYVPSTYKWFCVGGDADDNRAGGLWRGDVVIARVYDDPLTEANVTDLWNLVKDATAAANTGISNPQTAGFSIYPNPASEVANIDLTQIAGNVPVQIYTAQGVKASEQTLSGGSVQSVSLSGLTPGAYTLRVNGVAYKLIVK
jgi:glycerophosphoryl diester phosphodiesterase